VGSKQYVHGDQSWYFIVMLVHSEFLTVPRLLPSRSVPSGMIIL